MATSEKLQKTLVLDADRVQRTIRLLHQRIDDRFPQAGLGQVCQHLAGKAGMTRGQISWLRKPHYSIRLLSWLVVLLLIVASSCVLWIFVSEFEKLGGSQLLQVAEAAFQVIVLIAVSSVFFLTLEKRIKRARALAAIHELRSLAHIIDMHQLTKDPERATSSHFLTTPSSPKSTMNAFQLRRYLDYCTELLSLTAKIAALYAQDLDDATVLNAVSDVENLTTDLSRKIWQKISLVHSFDNRQPGI